MISIRRGGAAACANSGDMQSSIGKARVTPAPRRNERRGMRTSGNMRCFHHFSSPRKTLLRTSACTRSRVR